MADRPIRIRLSRAKGWRMPPNTVKVDRATIFGNPWTLKGAKEAGFTGTDASISSWNVSLFREWVSRSPSSPTRMLLRGEERLGRLEAGVAALRGKNLACWCALDEPCHADVLLELANQ